mmetsp:Transcript_60689/g.112598  ORF Transcript_60689/g.112598 Transcript_60689/m.112598 type:complete len:205 (+) Transcript_60689:64-678(+)
MKRRCALLMLAFLPTMHGQEEGGESLTMYSGPVPALHPKFVYDPAARTDPFDNAGQDISDWITSHNPPFECFEPHWVSHFCSCLENGNLAAWYQESPAVYIVDMCSEEDGLVLRTGHLQWRYKELLPSETACDLLKLITYCFSVECESALNVWNTTCMAAHYTVPGCDVDCNAAVPWCSLSWTLQAVLALLSTSLALTPVLWSR